MRNFTFRDVNEGLRLLSQEVMTTGDEIGSRNGATMELPFTSVTLTEPWNREILIPQRKASLPAQIAETMWVLAGRNDVGWLSHYLPRAAEFSDDGDVWRGGYGPRLRNWYGIDQLSHVFNLLNTDRRSRQAVMNIYDPAVDTYPGLDVPCNDWIHFLSRKGKLDMHVAVRSNDLIWGWSGINTFEWSAIQEILAAMLGVDIGRLHFSISSLHVYGRHWNRVNNIAESGKSLFDPGGTRFDPQFAANIDELNSLIRLWFEVEGLIRDGHWHADEAIASFPEPMLQEWLRVIRWYHTDDEDDIALASDRARTAALASAGRPKLASVVTYPEAISQPTFNDYVSQLHEEKHKAYGDSWKRRGEMLGILANIARKVDRLGVDGAGDSSADTAIDLLCYLAKYRWWLAEFADAPVPVNTEFDWPNPTDRADIVTALLGVLGQGKSVRTLIHLENNLTKNFESLEYGATYGHESRYLTVDHMLRDAYDLASQLWWREQNATRSWKGYEES